MSVKRFKGVNNRDVMRQVRAELGPDALILSSRNTGDGVEITAQVEMAATAAGQQPPPAELTGQSADPSYARPRTHTGGEARHLATPARSGAAAGGQDGHFAQLAHQLLAEVQQMREQLNRQESASDPAPREAGQPQLVRQLIATGMSPELSVELVQQLPTELQASQASGSAQQEALAGLVDELLLSASTPNELLESGGVVALVGPTGVGKTTTTAKLAAHYLQQHRPEELALITTDSYRIGAREQLQIYADLLGVDLYGLDDAAHWQELRDQLARRKLVLVDTVGMSQRDQRVVEQLSRLAPAEHRTRLVLLLNAASRRETLQEVVQAHQQAAQQAGLHLDDCLITKQDEAYRLGAALDTVIGAGLRLHYVSHGQRVPEDISAWHRERLAAESLPQVGGLPGGEWAHEGQPDLLLGQGRRLTRTLQQMRQQLPEFNQVLQSWADLDADWQPPPVEEAAFYMLPETEPAWLQGFSLAGEPLLLPRPRVLADAPDAGLVLTREPLVDEHPEAPWIAPIHRNRRVWLGQQRQPVHQCYSQAREETTLTVRYQGRTQQLKVRQCQIHAQPDSPALMLLMARLVSAGKRQSVRHYWVLPADLTSAQWPALLQAELYARQNKAIVRQALELTTSPDFHGTPPAQQSWLAQALAGTVARLQAGPAEQLEPLGQQLLRLTGRRGQADSRKLLHSCWQVLAAYNAMHYVQQQTEGASW